MKPRRKPVQREKGEQANGIALMKSLGAVEFVSGTRRPAGRKCDRCGNFVREHQGTCQTPGIADVEFFVPPPPSAPTDPWVLLKWEAKAPGETMRPAQRRYRAFCEGAGVEHVAGDYTALVGWVIKHGYRTRDQFPHYRLPAADGASTPTIR